MPDPRAPASFFSRLRAWLVHGKADADDIPAFIGALLGAVLVGIPAVVYLIVPLFAVLETMRTSAGMAPQDEGNAALFARFSMLAYVALIGLALAGWRSYTAERQVRAQNRTLEQTAESLRLTEARNLTDNFTKAIELMGARDSKGEPALELRLGAIYALERIARDNLDYHIQIMETLCAYVRQHAPAIPGEVFPGAVLRDLEDERPDITDEEVYSHPAFVAALRPLKRKMRESFTVGFLRASRQNPSLFDWSEQSDPALHQWLKTRPRPREDIRATLDVIGRRGEEQRLHEAGEDFPENPRAYNGYQLDLRNTRLCHISPIPKAFDYALFQDAQMEGADFSKANLGGARLDRARIEGSDFSHARMEKANFAGARMAGAVLSNAGLKGARFNKARMEGSRFFGAKMAFADLGRARMEGVNLSSATIEGASFENAQMQKACLQWAQLDKAALRETRLEGAQLSGAILTGSSSSPCVLERTNLTDANSDGCALRFIDFTDAIIEPSFFANTFGDASVILPEGISGPLHWSNIMLDDATFFGCWRGWVEAGPQPSSWRFVAPEAFKTVPAIPPPDGLTWGRGANSDLNPPSP